MECPNCGNKYWSIPPDDSAPTCSLCSTPFPSTAILPATVDPCKACGYEQKYSPTTGYVRCATCNTTRKIAVSYRSPDMLDCPSCGQGNYRWKTACAICHAPMRQPDPKLLTAGNIPIVLTALNDSVDDMPPGPNAKAYTLKVGRRGDVPVREPNYEYLARWAADMYQGEADYGLGVDTLACQYGTMYSGARLRAGLSG